MVKVFAAHPGFGLGDRMRPSYLELVETEQGHQEGKLNTHISAPGLLGVLFQEIAP